MTLGDALCAVVQVESLENRAAELEGQAQAEASAKVCARHHAYMKGITSNVSCHSNPQAKVEAEEKRWATLSLEERDQVRETRAAARADAEAKYARAVRLAERERAWREELRARQVTTTQVGLR